MSPMNMSGGPLVLCEESQPGRYWKLAPKAVEWLADDWERLVTFYPFPREH